MSKPKTFAELDESESVTKEELFETLQDYVDTRAAINPRVVIEIIRKLALSTKDKENLRKIALEGVSVKLKSRCKGEYQEVADFLLH